MNFHGVAVDVPRGAWVDRAPLAVDLQQRTIPGYPGIAVAQGKNRRAVQLPLVDLPDLVFETVYADDVVAGLDLADGFFRSVRELDARFTEKHLSLLG